MKNLITILALSLATSLSNNAIAESPGLQNTPGNGVSDQRLVSPMNFMLGAMKITNLQDGKVRIIVDRSIVEYSDNRALNAPDLPEKLQGIFEQERVEALAITLPSTNCRSHPAASEIFNCSMRAASRAIRATVQTAMLDWNGNLQSLGEKIIETADLGIAVVQVRTRTVDSEDDSLRASIALKLAGEHIYLVKSRLEQERDSRFTSNIQ